MVHATEIKPRRKENPFEPHPDPSVTCVNTHVAGCLSGVSSNSAIHIPTDAKTGNYQLSHPRVSVGKWLILLMGANQRIIRCRLLVVKEQITPITQRRAIAKRTVCKAVLEIVVN